MEEERLMYANSQHEGLFIYWKAKPEQNLTLGERI
jgi:hypothetical protein